MPRLLTKASALPDAPISTGSVTKVKTTAAPNTIRPTRRAQQVEDTPAMISQGARPEPSCAAGTIAWRAVIHGSRSRSWRACPTSWAMTAAAATERVPEPCGNPPVRSDGCSAERGSATWRADAQNLAARVVVVGQLAGDRLDVDVGETLAVEEPAGEVEGSKGQCPESTFDHLA